MEKILSIMLNKDAWRRLFRSQGFLAVVGTFLMDLTWSVLFGWDSTMRGFSFPEPFVNSWILAMVIALPIALGARLWVQMTIWLAYLALLEANLMYFRTYMTWIPLSSYLLVGNLADFTASIHDSLRLADIFPLLIIIVTGIVIARRNRRLPHPTPKVPYLGLMIIMVAVSSILALSRGGIKNHIEQLRGSCYYATTPPVLYKLPGTLLATSFNDNEILTPEIELETEVWLAEQQRRDAAYPIADREGRRNLVVIFCESLESWLIGAKADGDKTITPYLNSLLADSTTLYLPHVASQVGTGRSIDAQLLMLAGMMPLDDAVWSMRYPDRTYPSIAKAMHRRDADARATLLTIDKPITWNQSLVSRAFEVDTMLSRDDWKMTELVGKPAKLSDGAFMTQSVDKMKAGLWPEGQPAFIQVVTYSGHNPFRLQPELRGIEINSNYPERLRDYMTMANYTDRSLRPMIEYLKSRSDWDSTMVVIVGDHEALGTDRAKWLAEPEAAKILSPASEVPMIVLNSPVAGRIDKTIGQVDVYSTIIDLMGLRPHAWVGLGQSVFAPGYTEPDMADDHERMAPKVSSNIIKYDLLKDKLHDRDNP